MPIEKRCEPYLNSVEVIRIVQSNNDTFLHRVLDCIKASRDEICCNVVLGHYLLDSELLRLCREDAFQNTQSRFVQNVRAHLFKAEREDCIPYLKTLFRRLYLREYQKELRRKLAMETWQPPAPAAIDAGESDEVEKVKKILLQLSEEDRNLYHLRYVEGYKVKEIALILGIDAASVTKKLQRLHRRFGDKWNEL